MEILVTTHLEYEDPERPGLFLNHFIQFVDRSPDFRESLDFQSSFKGVNVRSLRVRHEEVPKTLPAVTHFGFQRQH